MFGRCKAEKKRKQTFAESVRSLIFIIFVAFFIRTYFYGLYQVPTPSMESTLLVGERFFSDKLTVLFKDVERGDIIALNQPPRKQGYESGFEYSENPIINWWQRYVWGPINYTKRVIGAPGDELKGVMEDGKPVIYLKKSGDDKFAKLDEPYLNQYPIIATYEESRPSGAFTYRSYDPQKSFDDQPFYQLDNIEVALGRSYATNIHDNPIKHPGTPFMIPTYSGMKNLDEFQIKLADDEYWIMGDNRLGSGDSRVFGAVKKRLIHGKIVFRIWSLDSDSSWWIFDLLLHPIDFWKKVRWSRCMQRVK